MIDFLLSVPYKLETYDTLTNKIFKTINTDYASFYLDSGSLETIPEVETHYNYYDLRPTDIVLDIGACIGAFSLKIRNKVSRIYAIEPIMTEYLRKNIKLNKAYNISIINKALGEGIANIEWNGIRKTIQGSTLTEIINECGGHIDFLKCDCEGGEWNIKKGELDNIRRIEFEIHLNGQHSINYFDELLLSSGFIYKKIFIADNLVLVSGHKQENIDNINFY